jgi:hypothetical protein
VVLRITAEDGLKPETVSAELKSEAARDIFSLQHPYSFQCLQPRTSRTTPTDMPMPLTSFPRCHARNSVSALAISDLSGID